MLPVASRGAMQVSGIEVDEKSYRYGRDRYKHPKLELLFMDIASMVDNTNWTGSFDFIYCSNVMEHIADYRVALIAVKKLLAPGGLYLQITPPSGQARGNPYHVTNYTVPEWREILKGFFDSQRYFAHIPLRERDDTNNEFDFRFEECGAMDIGRLKSISGMIMCQ